jgi:hypothetical protein
VSVTTLSTRADASERVRSHERPSSRPEGRPSGKRPLSGERGGNLHGILQTPGHDDERGLFHRVEVGVERLVGDRKVGRPDTGASPTRTRQLAGSPLPGLGRSAA